jgi:hypothetical protein
MSIRNDGTGLVLKGLLGVFLLVIVFAVAAGFTALTMVAWNVVIRDMFHGPNCTFWGAWAINFLVGLMTASYRWVSTKGK